MNVRTHVYFNINKSQNVYTSHFRMKVYYPRRQVLFQSTKKMDHKAANELMNGKLTDQA